MKLEKSLQKVIRYIKELNINNKMIKIGKWWGKMLKIK
jgi:hypothetical protein